MAFFQANSLKFSRTVFEKKNMYTFLFSQTGFKIILRKENKFHGWKVKNSRKFHGRNFDFQGEKTLTISRSLNIENNALKLSK